MLHARKDYQDLHKLDKKIPAEEPVFVIRAQDMASTETLRFWARENLRLGGDMGISASVEAHALRMERWRIKKLADL